MWQCMTRVIASLCKALFVAVFSVEAFFQSMQSPLFHGMTVLFSSVLFPLLWMCSHRHRNWFLVSFDPHLPCCRHGNRFAGCWGLAVQRNKRPSSYLERDHGPSAGNCPDLPHRRWLSVCMPNFESGVLAAFEFLCLSAFESNSLCVTWSRAVRAWVCLRFDCLSVSEPGNLPLSREVCLLVCLLHRTTLFPTVVEYAACAILQQSGSWL